MQRAVEIFLPVIAVGELYFGAAKSGRQAANRALLEAFIQGRTVLPCDLEVAQEYGMLMGVLRKHGTPLPDNDVWIAAIAIRHRLAILTRDKHFKQIADLAAFTW